MVTDWAGLIPSRMAGRVDVITRGMHILDERCANIDFSEPIGEFGVAFIVLEGNPEGLDTYDAIRDAGVTMAAVASYAKVARAQAASIPDDKIMQLPGITEVPAAVKSGRVSAGVITSLEALELSKKNEGIDATDQNALPKAIFNCVGIGFHPDDDAFRAEFNVARAKRLPRQR
ncbi:Sulfate starvation-induced protein 7 [Ruegeria denitrificans]|uniref:Sulfate starvation-induced protein 7 n=1 Tax=Ruegeria denitrificans TaxID=1715692 RepID=A0A0P1IK92_9RHOB|nr:transporter substrate-binding domain-containing protein [Ruegeria denitrificans]CUK18668.1 Sulfate starvation-induced protein 7 [Ruegeria denitrificans]